MDIKQNLTDDQIEEIIDNGEAVFENYWETDNPGAGADAERVIKFKGRYYACPSDDDVSGPYDTLEKALDATDFAWLNDTTVEIQSSELSADQIVQRLTYEGDGDHQLEINGEPWLATATGEFKRIAD